MESSQRIVAILLSTYNGEAYLHEQLRSFEAQSHPYWRIFWRDDGSNDGTRAIMTQFIARVGEMRCREIGSHKERLGIQKSFFSLLKAAQDYPFLAFADQDDVWLPEKVARALQYLQRVAEGRPALYCARQIIVDKNLRPLRWSPTFRPDVSLLSCLTQNIATGCTILLNQSAAHLIAQTRPPEDSLHDWWSYIVVTTAGGDVFFDNVPCILYRQHEKNAVGGRSVGFRIWRALHKRPASVLGVIDAHAKAVNDSVPNVSSIARENLLALERALRGTVWARLRFVLTGRLRRQRLLESLLLNLWVLGGRIE